MRSVTRILFSLSGRSGGFESDSANKGIQILDHLLVESAKLSLFFRCERSVSGEGV